MGLIGWIKKKWNTWYYHDMDAYIEDSHGEEDDAEEYDTSVLLTDPDQRTVYILENLEQMEECMQRILLLKSEYDAVTSLLVDMEEIERLPKEIRLDIMEQARKILHLEKERQILYNTTGRLAPQVWSKLERLEEEIPGGIRKIKEAEDYRKLVKYDMKKLDGERNACEYRRGELQTSMGNCRGVALICGATLVLCIVLLLFLQLQYHMDVRIGYIISAAISGITLTGLYIRYLESGKEIKRLAKTSNKLISLQNTVKIRYINNTNLLSYLYQKYETRSAKELESEWNLYMEETSARQKDETLREDLEFYYGKLMQVLNNYHIKDPEIWTHQAQALLDPREMVEVRHALIGRRQKLREQMEYNEDMQRKAKERIEELRKRYPRYRAEIDALQERYPQK